MTTDHKNSAHFSQNGQPPIFLQPLRLGPRRFCTFWQTIPRQPTKNSLSGLKREISVQDSLNYREIERGCSKSAPLLAFRLVFYSGEKKIEE